jgi:uncharacterized protein (DUF697 family)
MDDTSPGPDERAGPNAPEWVLVTAPGSADAEPARQAHAEIGDRASVARSIVRSHMLVGAGTGFLPGIGQDMSALMLNQVVLLRRIGAVYGQSAPDELVRTLVLALGTSLPAVKGAVPVLGLLRLIPGVGHLAGSVLLSATGACVAWATGMVFIQHFESGGTFLGFDPREVRAHFRREFERSLRGKVERPPR